MQFKIGDIVTIKDYEILEGPRDGDEPPKRSGKFADREGTIKDISKGPIFNKTGVELDAKGKPKQEMKVLIEFNDKFKDYYRLPLSELESKIRRP